MWRTSLSGRRIIWLHRKRKQVIRKIVRLKTEMKKYSQYCLRQRIYSDNLLACYFKGNVQRESRLATVNGLGPRRLIFFLAFNPDKKGLLDTPVRNSKTKIGIKLTLLLRWICILGHLQSEYCKYHFLLRSCIMNELLP